MKVKEIREEMKRRNITVKDIEYASGYSPSFTSSIMNRMNLDSNGLPVAIRRVLESRGILNADDCKPTERQLQTLLNLGHTDPVNSRDEASLIIGRLLDAKRSNNYPVYWNE